MVLPAPFGPMMPTISPGATLQRHVVDGADAAEAHGEVGDLERRHRGSVDSGVAAIATVAGVDAPRAVAARAVACPSPSAGGRRPLPLPGARRGRPPLAGASRGRRRPGAGALEEHRAQHVGAVEQLGGRAVEPDLALLHEVRRLGDGERHVHRLLDEDDGGALGRGSRSTIGSSCSTTTGARPSDELVDHQQAGPGEERHAERQHLLLAARQVGGRARRARSRRTGNSSSTSATRSLAAAPLRAGRSQPATRRFSATVSVGNTPWPPGHLGDAEGGDLVRRRVRDVAPVEDDRALVGLDHPADGLEQRRLAGAVRAEQRDDLALVDLEVDVEQHLHAAVADVRGRARAAASTRPWRRS